MINRRNVFIVLLIISWIIIPISIFSTQLTGSCTIDNIENNVPQISGDTTFTLYPIIPYPSTDGNIELEWDNIESIDFGFSDDVVITLFRYDILRKKDSGNFEMIGYVSVEHYYDDGLDVGIYVYKIHVIYLINYGIPCHRLSNEESIIVQEAVSPLTGESISINDGATTTNSYAVELSLYCDNAETMCFKLASDSAWTIPEPYITTKYINLPESSVDNPNYTVGVKYQKDTWETVPIYDDINVYIEGEPPPPPPEEDYTLLFILLGVLGGLIGIVVFLKFRKKGKKSN